MVPGKLLVFVRYSPLHVFHEWVYNAADIDGSRIVWANDLGAAEDEKLRRYYPDRAAWLTTLKQEIPMFAGDGRMPEGAAEREWRVLTELNPKYRPVKVEETYTNAFVEQALHGR